MPTIRFRPDSEWVLLVFTETRVREEYLEEVPDIRSSFLRCSNGGRAVGETNANGLVNV